MVTTIRKNRNLIAYFGTIFADELHFSANYFEI